ncbi:MAG: inverse autotransporter beta domain-containing protein [Legionellales bacterium]|nr:inverse autotransporter beta domain-containing protein [Legionellales bacterium]
MVVFNFYIGLMFKHKLSNTILLVLLGLSYFSLALGYGEGDKYHTHLDIIGKAGNKRSIFRAGLLEPFYQGGNFLSYGTIIGMADTVNIVEGNFGLGYRHIVNRSIFGGYFFYDVRKTKLKNKVNQLTFGLEYFTKYLDLRFNLYMPKSKTFEEASTPRVSVNRVLGHQYQFEANRVQSIATERALKGLDIDVGVNFPVLFNPYMRIAYYRFGLSRDVTTINGIRFCLGMSIFNNLDLNMEISNDKVREDVYFFGIAFRHTFDVKDSFYQNPLNKKMVSIPIRDVDIVVDESDRYIKNKIADIDVTHRAALLIDNDTGDVLHLRRIDSQYGSYVYHSRTTLEELNTKVREYSLNRRSAVEPEEQRLLEILKVAYDMHHPEQGDCNTDIFIANNLSCGKYGRDNLPEKSEQDISKLSRTLDYHNDVKYGDDIENYYDYSINYHIEETKEYHNFDMEKAQKKSAYYKKKLDEAIWRRNFKHAKKYQAKIDDALGSVEYYKNKRDNCAQQEQQKVEQRTSNSKQWWDNNPYDPSWSSTSVEYRAWHANWETMYQQSRAARIRDDENWWDSFWDNCEGYMSPEKKELYAFLRQKKITEELKEDISNFNKGGDMDTNSWDRRTWQKAFRFWSMKYHPDRRADVSADEATYHFQWMNGFVDAIFAENNWRR